jgi:hypothetical protein
MGKLKDYTGDPRRQRGRVLRLLDQTYPRPLEMRFVREVCEEDMAYQEMDIKGVAAYLEDKGYVTVTRFNVGNEYEQNFLTLTSKGKDLVDGQLTCEVGVELG